MAADDQESTLPFAGADRPPARVSRLMLTVLAHSDPRRIGDRLWVRGPTAVSRTDGRFGPPGDEQAGAALGSRWLSRSPIELTPLAGGGLEIRHDPTRCQLGLGGAFLPAEHLVASESTRPGVALVLNGAVALLLHRHGATGAEGGGFAGSPNARSGWGPVVGRSAVMDALRVRVTQAAAVDLPVLVRGETGTGKELVARALHDGGPRTQRPFIAINLGAIPPELAASALFGHTSGAFSGAGAGQPGAFRAADGGTLLLDEVGEAPAAVQTALLRVLESGEIQPVGRSRPERVDVRVIAATDADLEGAVAAGRFRAALLERLGALELRVPALRERPDDVGRLLYHFLARGPGAERLRAARAPEELWPPAAIVARLATAAWPRNVRQLRNIAHEMATFSVRHPFRAGPKLAELLASRGEVPDGAPEPTAAADPEALTTDALRALLGGHRWRISVVARHLGLSQGGMYGLLRRHGIPIARDLDRVAFERAWSEAGGDVRSMAEQLEMSVRALTLRRRQLGLTDDR